MLSLLKIGTAVHDGENADFCWSVEIKTSALLLIKVHAWHFICVEVPLHILTKTTETSETTKTTETSETSEPTESKTSQSSKYKYLYIKMEAHHKTILRPPFHIV